MAKKQTKTKKMQRINKKKLMSYEGLNDCSDCRSGLVLLVTLALLIVLSMVGYTLSSRIAARRHRERYIIDYQKARYGCDSAVKYALAILQDIKPQVISRPNEPDFSDLFYLGEEEYQELLAEAAGEDWRSGEMENDTRNDIDINDIYDINDANDINDVNAVGDFSDSNTPIIPGPYGPPWPLVAKPMEFEIGSSTVTIEIEDENAKYPLGWMLLSDAKSQREVVAGFETFCEWMDINEIEIDALKMQLGEISKIKPFKLEFKPRKKKKLVRTTVYPDKRGRRRVSKRPRFREITVSPSRQIARQSADFSKLFHCSLVDTDLLARPTIESETRKESTLKYTGMWASRRVNINTAPRHVLEAAFVFGGDADRIADGIIRHRRIKPFKDVSELRSALFRYSDSIKKCEKYITTVSNLFTIKVTAVSGAAKASAVIAVSKEGGSMKKIAVFSY